VIADVAMFIGVMLGSTVLFAQFIVSPLWVQLGVIASFFAVAAVLGALL
jgi:hypothetical protein